MGRFTWQVSQEISGIYLVRKTCLQVWWCRMPWPMIFEKLRTELNLYSFLLYKPRDYSSTTMNEDKAEIKMIQYFLGRMKRYNKIEKIIFCIIHNNGHYNLPINNNRITWCLVPITTTLLIATTAVKIHNKKYHNNITENILKIRTGILSVPMREDRPLYCVPRSNITSNNNTAGHRGAREHRNTHQIYTKPSSFWLSWSNR